MGFGVCGGAVTKCPFGAAPSVLNVLPQNKVVNMMPMANIMDNKPLVNIMPFAMCNSISNPTVAAATAAAMGALTPMPCVPSVAAPWSPGSSTVTIGGQPALTDSSQCRCMWGGAITVSFAGQATIMVG
ncbi:MAG: DUF4280 domain-containing protein [Oscillospiraceae bacterium]|jgi:uncharacterized Zn-binding protein involved in type VI secretion|nr:DUF4280 domain-containing protein [Oscillospiraceae bacterium]